MNGQLGTTEGIMSWDQLQVGCHVENWDKCDRRGDVCLNG